LYTVRSRTRGFVGFGRPPPNLTHPEIIVDNKKRKVYEQRQARRYEKSGFMFGRPFVKRFSLCRRTVVCLSRPVCDIGVPYCGQTVGWIKMPLGMEVGLSPGHIVLDRDPASASKRGTTSFSFRAMSVVVKRLGGSKSHLIGRKASAQAALC